MAKAPEDKWKKWRDETEAAAEGAEPEPRQNSLPGDTLEERLAAKEARLAARKPRERGVINMDEEARALLREELQRMLDEQEAERAKDRVAWREAKEPDVDP